MQQKEPSVIDADRTPRPSLPWTRALHLDWRPNPRAYDRRSEVIEKLEDVAEVDAFRMHEGGVMVTSATGHEVRVNVHGLDVSVLTAHPASQPNAHLLGKVAQATFDACSFSLGL